MNKLHFLVSLILFGLISCEDKHDTKMDLLIGKWNQKTDINIKYTPTVTFFGNGEYKICDLINLTSVPKEVTISGEFNFKNNVIELVTASVVYNNTATITENTDIKIYEGNSIAIFFGHWSADSISNSISTRTPLIIPGYSPMIWNVIVLTEDQLRVIKMSTDTITYEK